MDSTWFAVGRFPRFTNAAVLIFGSGDNGTKELKEEKGEVVVSVANEIVRSDGSATGEEGMLCAAKERDMSSSPLVLQEREAELSLIVAAKAFAFGIIGVWTLGCWENPVCRYFRFSGRIRQTAGESVALGADVTRSTSFSSTNGSLWSCEARGAPRRTIVLPLWIRVTGEELVGDSGDSGEFSNESREFSAARELEGGRELIRARSLLFLALRFFWGGVSTCRHLIYRSSLVTSPCFRR